jgi:hypothetical protein
MIFYGIFLADQAISAILDVVRFLGEPNKIRFSHITMRGPYAQPLRRERINELRHQHRNVRLVRLTEPSNFFNERQSTVVIGVDLVDLKGLYYKKDFPDGLPHITLYDGRSRGFARALYNMVSCYKWSIDVSVTDLIEIPKSHPTDQVFTEFYTNFYNYFNLFVGDRYGFDDIKKLPDDTRLGLIYEILERCVDAAEQHIETPVARIAV